MLWTPPVTQPQPSARVYHSLFSFSLCVLFIFFLLPWLLTCFLLPQLGFAIGSAAMVSLALFGAFVTKAGIVGVDIMKPFSFFGLLVGAMLPYAFSAMTMKSVGIAANAMVVEVRRQFREIPGLMEGTGKADYSTCVAISTKVLGEKITFKEVEVFTMVFIRLRCAK